MSVTADLVDVRALGTVHDYGDQALLLEFDSTAEVLAWAEALRDAELLGVLDIVPASRTVLLKLAGPRYQAPTRQRLGKLRVTAEALAAASTPVDGRADIEIELTTDQVIAAHTGTPWRVGFGGFAPGFGYLIGGDERLNVPRQSEPRTRVPAGSVALAGEFSAIYPRESPGGWQLIGHVADDNLALWDIDRSPPALLQPGMWVQFRAVK
jgi:allophanate hydrolase subunit 1